MDTDIVKEGPQRARGFIGRRVSVVVVTVGVGVGAGERHCWSHDVIDNALAQSPGITLLRMAPGRRAAGQ